MVGACSGRFAARWRVGSWRRRAGRMDSATDRNARRARPFRAIRLRDCAGGWWAPAPDVSRRGGGSDPGGAARAAWIRLQIGMRGVRGRSAQFVCVIALVDGGRLLRTFRGAVEGRILEAPRGPHGFGYDPLFYYPAERSGNGGA